MPHWSGWNRNSQRFVPHGKVELASIQRSKARKPCAYHTSDPSMSHPGVEASTGADNDGRMDWMPRMTRSFAASGRIADTGGWSRICRRRCEVYHALLARCSLWSGGVRRVLDLERDTGPGGELALLRRD